jgi:hypothetical protein
MIPIHQRLFTLELQDSDCFWLPLAFEHVDFAAGGDDFAAKFSYLRYNEFAVLPRFSFVDFVASRVDHIRSHRGTLPAWSVNSIRQ